MSFGLGLAITAAAVVIAMVCFIGYLIADYTERKNYNKYMKYRMKVRDRQTVKAHQDIEAAIWDSCRMNANYIVKELSRK